jgi:hypothetical protein
MEVDALLDVTQAAVRSLEVWISLEGISKHELENYFQVRADDCVAEHREKGHTFTTGVFSRVGRDQVSELLVYFLKLFLRHNRNC